MKTINKEEIESLAYMKGFRFGYQKAIKDLRPYYLTNIELTEFLKNYFRKSPKDHETFWDLFNKFDFMSQLNGDKENRTKRNKKTLSSSNKARKQTRAR